MRHNCSYMCVSNYKYQLFTKVDLFYEKNTLPLLPGNNYVQFCNLTTEHTGLLRRDLIVVW